MAVAIKRGLSRTVRRRYRFPSDAADRRPG